MQISLLQAKAEIEETKTEKLAREAAQIEVVISDIRRRFPGTASRANRFATPDDAERAGIVETESHLRLG